MEKHVTLFYYNDSNYINVIKTDVSAIIENNKLTEQCIKDIFKKHPYVKTIEDRIWKTTENEIICRACEAQISEYNIVGCYYYPEFYNDNMYDGEVKCLPLYVKNKCGDFNYITPILNYYYLLKDNSLDTYNFNNLNNMFAYCKSLTFLDLSRIDTKNVYSMARLFEDCINLKSITFGDMFDTSNVKDMSYMFKGCKNLKHLDLSKFDTSKVVDMSGMFEKCRSLTTLDLSTFDTNKVTNMNQMFRGCKSLKTITFGTKFDTDKCNDVFCMFYRCDSIESVYFDKLKVNKDTLKELGQCFENN